MADRETADPLASGSPPTNVMPADQPDQEFSPPEGAPAGNELPKAQELTTLGKFQEVIENCHAGLHLAEDSGKKFELLRVRSKAFSGLSRWIRTQSASTSEMTPVYGQDPTCYASMAKEDAVACITINQEDAEAWRCMGEACFLLEEFVQAKASYEKGLTISSDNPALKAGMEEISQVLGLAAAEAEEDSDTKQRPSKAIKWDSELECTLCMEMLYEPVTTPCGHTFCQACFCRAVDHKNRCPMCRVVLHVGNRLPVTVVLKSLLQRNFPDRYEARRLQEEEAARISEAAETATAVPMFVMSSILPHEHMSLNIFEPRYRLMIRRCMEGNRCFGMSAVDPTSGALLDDACQVEIVECQPLPDGRFGIEIEGKQRFKIAECWEQDGYRVARPVFYSDTPVPEGTPEAEALGALAAEVEDLADRFVAKVREILSASRQPGTNRRALQQLLCRAGSKPAGPPETDMYQALSFWAGALSIHNDADRQDMIRMRDTKLRLQLVKGHLAELHSNAGAGMCALM
mmetsp:Transcript_39169/g.110907  ORF Transcript_39169/g.110907 Transcript_39169/m.110907 type:complete len:517 (+) Transcript_39169:175-1725(+)|eukprot:CAMPEP_0117657080 /NCGR_PEP_ID=MMETSP0804-20121206/5142_1 /TAXON_ID=1074897 /ORGANISM="Tetraselmis astigmatica, Strain CCMP880" /LENGTH=516 /DNA_ID=CAMNT_0005463515 /DNA_START=216 /DNA_END=1766 /DNA_ORIENTATION=+